jgi:hypothetical protein
MAENRSLAAREHGSEPSRVIVKAPMANRVNAAMNPVQPACLHPAPNACIAHVRDELLEGHKTVLPGGNQGDSSVRRGDFPTHVVDKSPRLLDRPLRACFTAA